jgi:hypothetical protein
VLEFGAPGRILSAAQFDCAMPLFKRGFWVMFACLLGGCVAGVGDLDSVGGGSVFGALVGCHDGPPLGVVGSRGATYT